MTSPLSSGCEWQLQAMTQEKLTRSFFFPKGNWLVQINSQKLRKACFWWRKFQQPLLVT